MKTSNKTIKKIDNTIPKSLDKIIETLSANETDDSAFEMLRYEQASTINKNGGKKIWKQKKKY